MRKPLAAVIVILSAAAAVVWAWKQGCFPPSWVKFEEKIETVESEHLRLALKNRRLSCFSEDQQLYETPDSWFVSDFLTDDFDEDGITEVLFLVWRQGDYGIAHPFWETPDPSSFYQHLYLFELCSEGLKRQWMSSALRPNFASWEICNHELHVMDPYGEATVWKWHGYGIARIDGPFAEENHS